MNLHTIMRYFSWLWTLFFFLNTSVEAFAPLTRLRHTSHRFGSQLEDIQASGSKIIEESSAAVRGVFDVLSEVNSLPASPESIGLLCDKIIAEEDGAKLKTLKSKRYLLLAEMLKRDRALYVETVSFFISQIPRADLPNVQDIPYFPYYNNATTTTIAQQTAGEYSAGELASYQKPLETAQLVDASMVQNTTYSDSPLDVALLAFFRSLVQRQINYKSTLGGIKGLLDEGRTYMLSEEGSADDGANQHRMVREALGGLLTPVLPPFYRLFMAGVVPCAENGDPDWLVDAFAALNKLLMGEEGEEEGGAGPLAPGKALFGGPLLYAPVLTSVATPPFIRFLLGPCRPNYRKDGQLGGMVVEKCRFLQESGCKGLCLHQCKLPAQQ